MFRIGLGYDVHRLVKGRRLILGGMKIPFNLGLNGHSDADVLLHAICDSLLGAAGLGDIGMYFPDNDQTFKDISSIILLKNVAGMIAKKGYSINNIDTIIIAQEPKLAPYIPDMCISIASALNIEKSRINIKATTTEGLGFTGEKRGIAAKSIVMLIKD